jgi:preprotein translocase subunit SecA
VPARVSYALLQDMPSDAVVYALVVYAWLTWFTAQQRKLITLAGSRQGRHAANGTRQGKPGHDGGLIVLQWGAAHNGRIERQLRGRAGRQGDPGESHVIISMEDPTMYVMHESLILQEQLLER